MKKLLDTVQQFLSNLLPWSESMINHTINMFSFVTGMEVALPFFQLNSVYLREIELVSFLRQQDNIHFTSTLSQI